MTDQPTTPPTELELDEIETRAAHLHEYACQDDGEGDTLAGADVPLLLDTVRRQRADLEAATEFRLTPAPPAYTPLIVRRDPAYDGTRWAVLHDPGDIAVRRTWTAEGWEMAWASTDDEIFCWPDAETALVQARRAQGDGDNEPDIDGAGRTYESYCPRSAGNATPEAPVAPLAASQPPEAPTEPETATEGATGRAGDSGPDAARIALTRSDLAALLAHHADVLAARWRAVAPGAGAWEVAAALSLTSHANELSAETERPAVTELLDNIWTFNPEQQATTEDPAPAEDFTGTQPCGHDDYHDPHPWHGRPNLWCPGIGYDDDQAAAEETAR